MVLDMPQWVLNEINAIVKAFLWKGKGVRIAHKTLIGEKNEGGLKLMDIETKKKAIRIKVIKKYLYEKTQYGWKYFCKKWLYQCGGCGESGLLMSMKPAMRRGIPEFYREVFEAWAEGFGYMEYKCTSANMVINQPVFLNPKIKREGKVMFNKVFFDAGMRQVKDFIYEVIPGFLPEHAVIDCIREWDEEVKRESIIKTYEDIKGALKEEWRRLIESNGAGQRGVEFPLLYVEEEGKKRNLCEMKLKEVYQMMIKEVVKRPASEKLWTRVFGDFGVGKIWENMYIKNNSIECENLDFKLRHNRMYTNINIHQFNENVKRECDVCGAKPETLMHLFWECTKLKSFLARLKIIIVKHWGRDVDVEGDLRWKKTVLFGVWGKRRKVNLVNYVLSHARYAIWLRRNKAHFEDKEMAVWVYFEATLRKNVFLILKYGKEDFENFIEGSKLIWIRDDGKLDFDF